MSTLAEPLSPAVHDLCRNVSQVCGWDLSFTPAIADTTPPATRLSTRAEDCPWRAEISDGRERVGVLHLARAAHGTSPATFERATELARSVAQVLEQLARAARGLQGRDAQVATLLELGQALPEEQNLPHGLTRLLRAAVELTGATGAAFFLLDSRTEQLRLRAVFHLDVDAVPAPRRELRVDSVDFRAFTEQSAAVSVDREGNHPLLPSLCRAGLCAAVQTAATPYGVLWIYDRKPRQYAAADIRILTSLAAQLAGVLERAAWHRGTELQDRIGRDLRAASRCHAAGLLSELPADERYELAARCTSCYELGGDLCEVIPLTEDRTGIAVGDATGNSIPAALIMSAVRGALRAEASSVRDIRELLSRVNGMLCGIAGAHQFMSLCYGVYDAAARSLVYANAGHPVPLLIRDGQLQRLESHGLLLGIAPQARYRSGVLFLQPADVLVFYSDGISEARSSARELFGWRGIVAEVEGQSGRTAAELLDRIWNRMQAHAGGEAGDDQTLLVLKVR